MTKYIDTKDLRSILLFFFCSAGVIFLVTVFLPYVLAVKFELSSIGFFAFSSLLQQLIFLSVLVGVFFWRGYTLEALVGYFRKRFIWKGRSLLIRSVGGGFLFYIGISILLTLLTQYFGIDIIGLNGDQSVFTYLGGLELTSWYHYALLISIVCLIAPLVEEIIYRGFITDVLMRHRGGWGVIAGAILFAGVHMEPDVIVNLTLLAGVLGYIYRKSESLWYPFIFHVMINSLGILSLFLV